jgi:predicted nucleic acid-binding protein
MRAGDNRSVFLGRTQSVVADACVETSERGVTRIGFRLDEETAPIRILMERYANVPMSLADACLVRMAEMTGLPICTTDSDFFVYRTHRRQPLTLITPGPARYMHEA